MENIYPYNINIIVVINKTEKGDFKLAKEKIENEIKAKGLDKAYLKFKYFEIKKSRALPNISKTKKSVSEQAKHPLLGYAYKQVVLQFDELINYIRGLNG